MQRVERHIRLNDGSLDNICYLSKNLYNYANFLIRQEFINSKRWLRYIDVYKSVKNGIDYKNLPAQTSQQVLK